MRFGLDDDREALRSTARGLLAELCPASAVRTAWEQAPDPAVWQALADAGALTMLVPPDGAGWDSTRPTWCQWWRRPAGQPCPIR